jgi:hypothetical protein
MENDGAAAVLIKVISFTGKRSSLFISPVVRHSKLRDLYPSFTSRFSTKMILQHKN